MLGDKVHSLLQFMSVVLDVLEISALSVNFGHHHSPPQQLNRLEVDNNENFFFNLIWAL